MHPTVKPLALVSDAILDCSRRGGIVLDAFAGSGTTLIAAEKTGRRGYGIEIDTYYADTIIRRFAEVYGLEAVHSETEKTFEEMSAKRLALEGARHAKEKGSKIKNSKTQRGKAVKGRGPARKDR